MCSRSNITHSEICCYWWRLLGLLSGCLLPCLSGCSLCSPTSIVLDKSLLSWRLLMLRLCLHWCVSLRRLPSSFTQVHYSLCRWRSRTLNGFRRDAERRRSCIAHDEALRRRLRWWPLDKLSYYGRRRRLIAIRIFPCSLCCLCSWARPAMS